MLTPRAGLLVLAVLLAGLPLLAGPGEPPVRRVFVAPDRLAAERAKYPGEVWKQLPRTEFEKLVARAEEAAGRKPAAPRLVEAHLRAVLRDEDLVGVATWQVDCPEPGVLPLQGPGGAFNLAVRQPPRAGDREVLLAEVDARGPALVFDRAGTHAVGLAWSARLERTPDGLAFDLRGPACPAGLLELYLPPGWGVTGPADVQLTGPGPLPEEPGDLAVPAGFVAWRVHGVGRGALRLTLTPGGQTNPPLALVRRWHTRHRIAPDAVETTLEAAIELLPRGGAEVAFEWDPSLRPSAVQVAPSGMAGAMPELAEWKLDPAADGQPALLTVRLRRPVGEVVVTVTALSALAGRTKPTGAVEWVAPAVRVVRGVPRGETVELVLHPDLRLEGWQAGDFEPTATDSAADPEGGPAWPRLALAGGGLRPDGATAPRRPSLVVHPGGVEFRARPVASWQLDPQRSTLRATVAVEVLQGRLFGVPIQVPTGWEVEQVEVEPAGATWRLLRRGGRPVVQIELATPLGPAGPPLAPEVPGPLRAQARVALRLRPATPGVPLDRAMLFPEVVVPGARFREGALAISVEDQLLEVADGRPTSSVPALDPDEDGPWGRDLPDYYFPYRQQPPTGSLTVRPRPPQVAAQVRTAVLLGPARSEAEVRLRLTAEAGAPDGVELLIPAADVAGWDWRVEAGTAQFRRVEAVPGVEVLSTVGAVGQPLAGLALLAVPTGPSPSAWRYRVVLTRPLRLRETVELAARVPLAGDQGRYDVPLPVLAGVERPEGEVEIHLAGVELGRVETDGLREAAGTTGARAAWRNFRLTGGPARLVLDTRAPSPGRLADAFGRLTAWPTDGAVRVHFQFHLADWAGPTLPVRLPAGVDLVALRVDGRAVDAELEGGGPGDRLLPLPVPRRDGKAGGWVCFELLYEVAAPDGLFWRSLEAPTPGLPVELATLTRTWRLPPGVAPAFDGAFVRLAGPGDGTDPPPHRAHPADLYRLVAWPRRWLGVFEPAGDTSAVPPRFPARPGQDVTRRESLEQFAQTAARDGAPVAVDTAAWREAGLRLDDRAGEPSALAILPAADGWLVTTRRQRDAWLAEGRALPEAVLAAVARALADGQDDSGRFRDLADWLPAALREEALPEGLRGETLLPGDLELAGWSAWLVPDGGGPGVIIVRREAVVTAGVALALLGGLGLLALRAGPRWRRHAAFVAWLTTAGLALFWLPTALQPLAWYSLVLAGVLVLVAYLHRLRRAAGLADPASRVGSKVSPVPVAVALAVVAVGAALAGQPEEQQAPPAVVLILGKADDPLEEQKVLAPEALLKQLEQAVDRPLAGPRTGAVFTQAHVTGRLVGHAVEFDARYVLHAFSDEPATVPLPVDGVLKEVWLDDAVIVPAAQVTLRGAGRHKLEVRYRVAVPGATPTEGAVPLALPKVPIGRLTFEAPARGVTVLMPGRGGAKQTRTEGGRIFAEADLGRLAGPVQVRWSAEPAKAPPAVRFQEAYLWYLRLDASALTGVLRYAIEKGSVQDLVLDVPAELVVRGVTATRPGGGEARLQGYEVKEVATDERPRQELTVRFQAPVTGDVLLLLDLIPRGPLPATADLPLPAPRGEQAGGHFAYQVDGLDAEAVQLVRLTGVPAAGFAPFWPAASRPEPGRLAFAATFNRPGGVGPAPRLRLTPRPAAVPVEQELSLRVGPRDAELVARIDLAATGSDLTLLEWELAGASPTVSAVRGPAVRSWAQQGNRLLVWLDRTTAAKVEVHGWLPLVRDGGASRFALPRLRLVSGGKQTTTLKVSALPGLALVPQQLAGLRPVGDAVPSSVEASYQANGPYAGTVLVEPADSAGTARVATLVEVVDRQFVFQTQVVCRAAQGELRSLTVSLRNWAGVPVKVEADRALLRRERTHGNGARTWSLEPPPGTREYVVTLSGSAALADLGGVPAVPEVAVGGVRSVETWVAVAGPDLTATAGPGLQPQAGLPADLPPTWRGGERLRRAGGSVWRLAAPPWPLRLAVASGSRGGGPSQVLLQERRLRSTGTGRWLHEAHLWLRGDEQPELTLDFPAAARVSGVAVDGVEVPPLQPSPGQLWVPLSGQGCVRSLRVRWEYEPGVESLARPTLEPLRLAGATAAGQTWWTLNVPPGWQAGSGAALSDGPGPRALAHLAQAEAALAAAAALGEEARESGVPTGLEAVVQQRFSLHLRRAELLLDRTPDAETWLAPDGTPAAEWADRLASRNRDQAKRYDYEEARAEADRQVKAGLATNPVAVPSRPTTDDRMAMLARGRETSEAPPWRPLGRPLLGSAPANAAPEVGPLESVADAGTGGAAVASLAWLGLVGGLVLLGRFDFLVSRLRYLVPEQLLLLGGLGYLAAGWTVVVVVLLGIGVLARLWLVAQWLRPARGRR